MDGIINVKVGGSHLSKDNKNAGITGEAEVTSLRISFDESWDKYAKTVTFFDARGINPVKRTLTTDLIEDIKEDTRTYLVPIPAEPLSIAGESTFVIDGYLDGKRKRSMEGKLVVKYAPDTDSAGEPTTPTPSQIEQLQVQIDGIMNDIQDAAKAGEKVEEALKAYELIKEYAEETEENANRAESYVGKTSYIGDNGNWFIWDIENQAFFDTGIKAQAGSTVYVGDNPPEEADVWIKPEGDAESILTPADMEKIMAYVEGLVKSLSQPVRSFVNILGGADNWTAEDVEDSNGNKIGSRYGQVVNVNNAVITPNSKVDLQITSEQMVIFHEKDLAFVAENDGGDGICKVLVDKKYRNVIGAHMIGSYASEMIFGAGIMVETEMRVDDIKEIVFPHPTVCEIFRDAIFQL